MRSAHMHPGYAGMRLLLAGAFSGVGLTLLVHQTLGAPTWSLALGTLPRGPIEVVLGVVLLAFAQLPLLLADATRDRRPERSRS